MLVLYFQVLLVTFMSVNNGLLSSAEETNIQSSIVNTTKSTSVIPISHKDDNKISLKSNTTTESNRSAKVEEVVTHQPREHVSYIKPLSNETGKPGNNTADDNKMQKESIHNIVPKKEASQPPSNKSVKLNQSTTTTTTTIKPIPQKPKITESSDDVLPIVQSYHDDYPDNKSNSSAYVIPIVAVILSVPLVAIVISVLYKRGADWWTHRNYRRMDFLIDGMYNN